MSYQAERDAYDREITALEQHQARLHTAISNGERRLAEMTQECQRIQSELENARLELKWTVGQREEIEKRRAVLESEIAARREAEQRQLLEEKHRQEAVLAALDARRRDVAWRAAEVDRTKREQELALAAAQRELEALEAQLIDECRETDRRQKALDEIGPLNPHGVPPIPLTR